MDTGTIEPSTHPTTCQTHNPRVQPLQKALQPSKKELTQFLKTKAKGDDSGNYRRNAKRVITQWIDWLNQRDIESFEQLDETVLALRRAPSSTCRRKRS
ncbi:hypothetical protein [Halalkalicoccus subterraneus]|uniref:hypothetical protein n=1 Tax=Halalkalicoccus subterraneus TaxID=2675002 RepID=UPI001B85FF38|nr:hypothetical protein [Halalkalicoccus subterraneus]